MKTFVYVVTIASTERSDIARVFTNEADADAFIQYCKEVDPNPKWEYEKHHKEIDGDPQDTFI
jgi:hypothetical protein